MDASSQASRAGSDNSSDSSWEMVEIVGEEIRSSNESLLQQGNDYSFTALNRSLQFLHLSESLELLPHPYNLERDSFTSSPPFPPDSALVEQEANSSVFAKFEPADPDSNSNSPLSFSRFGKRGEGETSKEREREVSTTGSWCFVEAEVSNPSFGGVRDAEAPVKKSRSAEHGSSCSREAVIVGEQLPHVHVRARRGQQATDSHSLAERVRREKISARMKLLTELVPGCNKISGKALLLDEIINYVQSLQRQVEFLSMKLAAVDPRINNLTGLHNSSSSERGSDAAVIIETEPSYGREFQFL